MNWHRISATRTQRALRATRNHATAPAYAKTQRAPTFSRSARTEATARLDNSQGRFWVYDNTRDQFEEPRKLASPSIPPQQKMRWSDSGIYTTGSHFPETPRAPFRRTELAQEAIDNALTPGTPTLQTQFFASALRTIDAASVLSDWLQPHSIITQSSALCVLATGMMLGLPNFTNAFCEAATENRYRKCKNAVVGYLETYFMSKRATPALSWAMRQSRNRVQRQAEYLLGFLTYRADLELHAMVRGNSAPCPATQLLLDINARGILNPALAPIAHRLNAEAEHQTEVELRDILNIVQAELAVRLENM